MSTPPPTSENRPDLIDRLFALLDHVLDVVHDRVLRPILLLGRTIAYLFVLVLVAVFLVVALLIGGVRLLDVYAFSGRVWITDAVIGVLSLVGGLLLWRRRRPVVPRAARD